MYIFGRLKSSNRYDFVLSMAFKSRKKILELSKCIYQLHFTSHRYVSKLSPLAIAFNTQPSESVFKKLTQNSQGLFGIEELHDHTGFYLLKENVSNQINDLVSEVTDAKRCRKVVEIFDEMSDRLCRVADLAEFVRISHPDESYRHSAEQICLHLTNIVEKLNTNSAIYQELKKVCQKGDILEMDDIDKRVSELFLFDFEQSGVDLSEEKKKHFIQLNECILTLGAQFQQGVQSPTQVSQEVIPAQFRRYFESSGDKIYIEHMMSDHPDPSVRELAYRLFFAANKQQSDVLEALFESRLKLSKLVGFNSYRHRTLRGTLVQNPENVDRFLNSLSSAIDKSSNDEFMFLQNLKCKHQSVNEPLFPWDVPFYIGLARHQQHNIDARVLSPYLSLGCCMEGLDYLFYQLWGVNLVNKQPDNGEVWSSDVYKLEVVHENEGVLGYIYCDLFERFCKPNQDCHFTIQGGRLKNDGTYQMPKVVLCLNIPRPSATSPSLLTPAMVENLFHEFGHAMHSMLGRTTYQHVTGTRCPTDFAEVPSILMEHFATDTRVLSKFARHWRTGETIPEKYLKSLHESKKLFASSDLQLQLFYSVLDQNYHCETSVIGKSGEILKEIQTKYYGIPHVDNTFWNLRFSHFIGYGAKYYSYLLSRAVASQIWNKCFKDNPFDRNMGEKYRKDVLSHGGSKPSNELVRDILNEEMDFNKTVNSIVDNL